MIWFDMPTCMPQLKEKIGGTKLCRPPSTAAKPLLQGSKYKCGVLKPHCAGKPTQEIMTIIFNWLYIALPNPPTTGGLDHTIGQVWGMEPCFGANALPPNDETRRNWISWTDRKRSRAGFNQGICAISAMRKSLPWRFASWHTSRHSEFLMRRDLSCECSPVRGDHEEDSQAVERRAIIWKTWKQLRRAHSLVRFMVQASSSMTPGGSWSFVDTVGKQVGFYNHCKFLPISFCIHTLYVREKFHPWSPNLL